MNTTVLRPQDYRVWVALVNEDMTEVLTGKRSLLCNNSNKWGLPGGSVEKGDSLKSAAWRELNEETGLIFPANTVMQDHIVTDKKNIKNVIYVCKVDFDRLDPKITDETSAYDYATDKWYLRDDLHKSLRMFLELNILKPRVV